MDHDDTDVLNEHFTGDSLSDSLRLATHITGTVNLMVPKNAIVFLIMLTVSAAGMAFAGDIFKWTDEHGNVHYGDRPTPETSEEPLPYSSLSTSDSV